MGLGCSGLGSGFRVGSGLGPLKGAARVSCTLGAGMFWES